MGENMEKRLSELKRLREENEDTHTMDPALRAGLYGLAMGSLATAGAIAKQDDEWKVRASRQIPTIMLAGTIPTGLSFYAIEKLRRKVFNLDNKIKEKKDEKKISKRKSNTRSNIKLLQKNRSNSK